MKTKIFTLVLALAASWGLVKAEEVQILNFATPNFTIEALNGATATIEKFDGKDVIKVITNSTAGWGGVASIKMNTPLAFGQYVSVKYDVNSDLDKYKGYLKLINTTTSSTFVEGWGVVGTASTWGTASWALFDYQIDGAGVRKTGTIDQILLIPSKDGNTNDASLDGKVVYYSNFRLEVGVDSPAKPQTTPSIFAKSNMSTKKIKMDGSDDDDSWTIPAENLSFKTAGVVATKGTFYSAWDAQKFYLYADCTDANTVVGLGDAGFVSWKGDGLQLYFDIYDRHFTAGVQGDQINGAGFAVGMQVPATAVGYPNATALQNSLKGLFGPYAYGVQMAQIKGGSSYKLEIGIPWEAFYYVVFKSEYNANNPSAFMVKVANLIRTEIKAGKKIGFGVQLNDNNGTDRIATESFPIMTPTNDGPYSKPANWAQLQLVGTGTPFTDPNYNNGAPTAINNVKESANANVYTVLGCINVDGENLSRVEVYSVSGQRLYSSAVEADGVTIPAKDYARGIYFVKVCDTSNRIVTKKIVL